MRLIDADALIENAYESDMFDRGTQKFNLRVVDADDIENAPSIDLVRCGECVHYDPPHVENSGKRIEYQDLPEEAFNDVFGLGFVSSDYGINVGGRCTVDYNIGYTEDKRVYRKADDYCSRGERRE